MNEIVSGEIRAAVAALLRIAEPGDGLLTGLVAEVGPIAVLELIRAVAAGKSSAAEAAESLSSVVTAVAGSGQLGEAIDRWAIRGEDAQGHRDLDAVDRLGGRLVIPGDGEWPAALTELGPAAPLGLWVRGEARLNTALQSAVSIVGARAASNYGTKCASDLAWDLAAKGLTIVSGGAFGIDAAAHRAVIAREGTTIAFMAGGVDRFYPAANTELFHQVLDRGAIVSETAPGMTPMRHRFLLRNRLIAASSRVTVIVEAGWRSGALNTARHALELSREVAAFPGSVYSASSTGTHRLIRLHEAQLVTSSEDVVELIGGSEPTLFDDGSHPTDHPSRVTADPIDDLAEREKICVNVLSTTKALDVGTVAGRAGLTVPHTLSALAVLELAGLSARRESGWVKVRRQT
ncbi:MAG: DNA-processing protein DprA [Brevibacterium sp.]|uniref:DNA-processing protein DprA n=1 Tax=Brevibacterium sp. TaxID=1701 RepID=UPI002649D678|nr:DNA-processing protein DprA [Brevibacterium sp.]MDN5807514.1 DNA-processing protein DprA [Brevibacterium sp.]MDN5833344.1 DNA-processing protein DprA [Brevibacterium sp.]MDN5877005.1 DNA-processing protein DprA [Brevibacterium sp.]MDN5908639.1 DNA-processing protein DprA [Brevibacterium sp.]MDN6123145.1 DNA-processing protein DprA [Brevibacterium sp.]